MTTVSPGKPDSELARGPENDAAFGLAQTMLESPEVAGAYEALFGDLRLARPFEAGNLILVTSTSPGEGKTTVSSCLAITTSRAGRTALLIDGDLRRSSLASDAGGPDAAGLIEVLLGEVEAAEAIRPLPALADSPRAGVVSFMSGGRKSAISLGAVDWSKAQSVLRSISQGFRLCILGFTPDFGGQ